MRTEIQRLSGARIAVNGRTITTVTSMMIVNGIMMKPQTQMIFALAVKVSHKEDV